MLVFELNTHLIFSVYPKNYVKYINAFDIFFFISLSYNIMKICFLRLVMLLFINPTNISTKCRASALINEPCKI